MYSGLQRDEDMKIEPTKIPGAYVIKREPFTDERGSFARMFCKKELEAVGMRADIAQVNLSTNYKKGTLRGLHLQKDNAAEDKMVACLSGAIFDVCIDVRKDSPTFGQWTGETLSAENGAALHIPKGCAHGFVTLQDNCQLLYFMSEFYDPNSTCGFRYDEPFFSIDWPIKGPYILSEQDSKWEYINGLTFEVK